MEPLTILTHGTHATRLDQCHLAPRRAARRRLAQIAAIFLALTGTGCAEEAPPAAIDPPAPRVETAPVRATVPGIPPRPSMPASTPPADATPEPKPDPDTPPRPPRPPMGKRLLHFQTVGFSDPDRPGQVSTRICTPADGWNAHVRHRLRPLVDRLGPGAFDWWGHRIGGVWPDLKMQLTETTDTLTLFEQMDIARQRFPQLADLAPLAQFAHAHGIDLYGYIGFPRCDSSPRFVFAPVPDHCDPQQFIRWYGPFVQNGFKGVGHDWSVSLPANSAVLDVNFARLRAAGIDPIIEAVPARSTPHLLGLSVVAEYRRWQYTQRHPDRFFTEREIRAAGGRAIYLITHPPPRLRGQVDVQAWRFDLARQLLRNGSTVAVPLDQLMRAGHPIEELVNLARRPAGTGTSEPRP